jgi:hypothetical protein
MTTGRQFLILLLALLLASAGCRGTPVVDDDDSAGDDDDSAGDDDDSAVEQVIDADGDGFDERLDCDDEDAAVNPGADELCDEIDNDCDGEIDEDDAVDARTWYQDEDGDGFGDDSTAHTSCSTFVTETIHGGDCNDTDPSFHPGAAESDCSDPADYNCDGAVGYADTDADGSPACEDCDDDNADLNAAQVEICDSLDNDCDGLVDEAGADGESSWYLDADGDGYGRLATSALACASPTGYVADNNDCDDLNPLAYPGAAEVCDEADNNCDGSIDEGSAAPGTWYADADGDGYGNLLSAITACLAPAGYGTDSSDCDDLNPLANPGAAEVCDEADNNCDGSIDEGSAAPGTWYADADGDGYGNLLSAITACLAPAGHGTNSSDCDDLDATSYPGGSETCDGADNNCDGTIDEGVTSTYFTDADGDGYGSPGTSLVACVLPAGASVNNLDCDDANPSAWPGGVEVCDLVDNNCDGDVDNNPVDAGLWYTDSDGDGAGNPLTGQVLCTAPQGAVATGTDCDDGDADNYPGNDEVCDGADNNCDGLADTDAIDRTSYFADADGDGSGDASTEQLSCTAVPGAVLTDDDCDDADGNNYPGATEVCDAADNNCDNVVDEGFDVDQDGFTTCGADGTSGNADDDCDDGDDNSYPGATDVADDGIDQDCDGADLTSICEVDYSLSLDGTEVFAVTEVEPTLSAATARYLRLSANGVPSNSGSKFDNLSVSDLSGLNVQYSSGFSSASGWYRSCGCAGCGSTNISGGSVNVNSDWNHFSEHTTPIQWDGGLYIEVDIYWGSNGILGPTLTAGLPPSSCHACCPWNCIGDFMSGKLNPNGQASISTGVSGHTTTLPSGSAPTTGTWHTLGFEVTPGASCSF